MTRSWQKNRSGNQGKILHLGAPMGSGKTTLIYQRAREAAATGAITLIVVPRVSLAKGVHADLRKDTSLGWGLFHEGQKGKIGEYGAVCTLGWMPRLLEKIVKDYPDRPIRIFIDEIDFAGDLWLADIFKRLSQEIKDALRERKDDIGIVTAGQTAYTNGLEAIAKELDCNLTGYYLSPRPAESIANLYIFDTVDLKQGKNRIIQDVIDNAQAIINAGKNAYIFGDERRSAQIIADYFGDKALLYDAYHRENPENAELIRWKCLPDDKQVFIATTAVDVGVSLKDKNAETIVFSVQNPINTNGLSSTVQQCLRNRTKPPLSIYLMKYQNALPLATKQAIGFETEHAKQKLADSEALPQGLVDQLGIKAAMQSLEADQPETFFKHHLKQAGYQVQRKTIDWKSVDFEEVKAARKRIKDSENEQAKEMAREILCPERMLTEREIRNKDWEQLQPAPTLQLAHERANALLRAAGWDGTVERFADVSNSQVADPRKAFQEAGVTEEMWEAAHSANDANLSPEKINHWTKGYLPTHHPSEAFDEFEASRDFEIHHRREDLFIGTVAKALLETLPRQPAPMEAVGQALIDAVQKPLDKNRLSALMIDGSVSPKIAKRVRFIKLSRDATPTQRHFDFVKRFISEYYPARIAKEDDTYQLVAPKNAEQVDAFRRLMSCRVKSKHLDIAPAPENGDLESPPASDPNADKKALVVSLQSQGHSYRDIEQATGVPRSTAQRWYAECLIRPTNFLDKAYIGNEWDTPSLPELPQTRTTTAFEAENPNVGLLSDLTSDIRHPTSDQTIREQILQILRHGEKRTAEMISSVTGKRTTIMDELKRLVDEGEIVRVKHGVYDLPSRAYSIDLPLESMTTLESMSAVTVESNGKVFRLRVNRKPEQAEGEAVISLFPKSKKYSTTMHAIEGGQASHPETFDHHKVTDGQELAKCLDIVSRHIIRTAGEPTVQQIKWLHERGISPEGVLGAANPD